MTKNLPIEAIQGGYSDIRLWPCYMVFSSLMLLLIPQIGTFLSLVLVGISALIIAKWVADRQPIESFDFDKWREDLDYAISEQLPLPKPEDYKITIYKTKAKPSKNSEGTVRNRVFAARTSDLSSI